MTYFIIIEYARMCTVEVGKEDFIFRKNDVIKRIISRILIFCMTIMSLGMNAVAQAGVTVEESTIMRSDSTQDMSMTTMSGMVEEENTEVGINTGAVTLSSPSAILLEASTGKVIYELNSTERRSPASITKIMTLLLIMEQLEKGKITLEDQVVTSAYAKSMGGSQVFLEEGEVQTMETMIKCIAVASGNDASVAVAEHIAGSEEAFVGLMNEKAVELGMQDTHFEDCCGLSDSDNHYTSAKDVSIMSRELITKYPKIFDYTTIWMEDITHVTRQGSSTFTLSSTNKLLKQYQWATGLKTGSTSKAKYCLSATAKKDNVELIAVVMGAPDYKVRFSDAASLLNFGFSKVKKYEDNEEIVLSPLTVKGGKSETVPIYTEGKFQYVDLSGADLTQITRTIKVPEEVKAPIEQGTLVGEVVYELDGEQIGSVSILYGETVEKAQYRDVLWKVFRMLLCP